LPISKHITRHGILQRLEADARARPLAAAGALFFDDDGQLLIVEPLYKSTWEIPGGLIERGETPRTALERALREELGLALEAARLLVVDWVPGRTGAPDEHLEFVFDGGGLTDERLDAIDLPPHEPESWACVPVADLFTMLSADLTRRVNAALDAIVKGETYYLENANRA
jgi:ADP-ribose pyrophosphatase YjhB (NUDIX family)